jgi:hypothetical protein
MITQSRGSLEVLWDTTCVLDLDTTCEYHLKDCIGLYIALYFFCYLHFHCCHIIKLDYLHELIYL